MAPSPLVGIKPMMASNAVLTETENEHQFSETSWGRNWVGVEAGKGRCCSSSWFGLGAELG